MGGEKSEGFYKDFLQQMRTVYRADAIKSNDNWFMENCYLFLKKFPVTLSLDVTRLSVAEKFLYHSSY